MKKVACPLFLSTSGLLFIYDKSDKMLYWIEDESGWTEYPMMKWPAVSGSRISNKPLPNGWYYLTAEERPAKSESPNMTDTCNNTYKFRLHPLFDTTRYGLLIHPDGPPIGITAGCIGVSGCTKSLRDFINNVVQPPPGGSDMPIPVYVRP